MADVKLTGNANWSTFKAGVTNGDTVYMNGFTLTIDEAITAYNNCIFTNAAGGTVSASAGGSAVLGGNYNVTLAGVTCSTTNSTALFQINAARTATLTLGTCQAGAGYAVVIQTGAGSVLTFVNTTFIGGTGSFCYGLYAGIGCTLTFTNCTATGGSGTSAHGVSPAVAGVTASGTLNLTQSASTGANSAAFYPTAGSGSLSGSVVHRSAGNTWRNEGGTWDYTITSETITGSIIGNGNQGLWMVLGSGVSTITRPAGTITHSVATHYGFKLSGAGVLTIVGDVTCGTNGSNYAAYDASAGAGSVTVNGTVTGPSTSYGSPTGLAAVASGKVFVKHVTVGAGGTLPSLTNVCFMSNSQIVAPISGSNITLVNSASAGDYPSAANVRSGTSYAYGALTGTCAVPGASSVASGVSVDNTTGTAVLTSAAAQSACNSALAAYETNGVASQSDLAGVTVDLSGVLGYLTAILAIFSGMTSLPNWLRRVFRKDAGTAGMATAQSEINTGGTSTFDGTGDSLESLSDQQDSIAAALAGAPVEPTGRIASGGGIVAYIGDDFRVRSGTQLQIPVSDPSGGLYTKLNAIGAANLAFGASRPDKAAGAISGTIASLATSGSGASQLLLITVEISNCGSGLRPGDDYTYQIEQQQTQGDEVDSFVEIEGSLDLRKKTV